MDYILLWVDVVYIYSKREHLYCPSVFIDIKYYIHMHNPLLPNRNYTVDYFEKKRETYTISYYSIFAFCYSFACCFSNDCFYGFRKQYYLKQSQTPLEFES